MSVYRCWQASARSKSGFCAGDVSWVEVAPAHYEGHCNRCGATGKAAVGETAEIAATEAART